eukprot:6492727-Amphidinium_carterae.1
MRVPITTEKLLAAAAERLFKHFGIDAATHVHASAKSSREKAGQEVRVAASDEATLTTLVLLAVLNDSSLRVPSTGGAQRTKHVPCCAFEQC